MNDQMYSAEEAAQVLGLQVRTVRNYVRDGRLPGVRIGKQYRITRADLEAFTGGGLGRVAAESPSQPVLAATSLEVSSVVEVEPVDVESADRITRTLMAVTVARAETAPVLRVEPMYDEARLRLKVIIVGSAADTVEVIRVVELLVREGTSVRTRT
jgi:excisionase family DNA binding protein